MKAIILSLVISVAQFSNPVQIAFGLTTLLTIFIFYKASHQSKSTLILLLAWIFLQMIISRTGFYTITDSFPPRFMLLVLPALLFIIGLFFTKSGRKFIDHCDIKILTLIHTVRIPVEIILYCLFLDKAIPKIMTFEGRNFDILAGLSSLCIYYLGFVKNKIGKRGILIWNIIGLLLLLNIVIIAVMSAPFTFQQFAFDQPDIAVLYFPFIWLPCCIVPLVFLSHLITIRQLIKSKINDKLE